MEGSSPEGMPVTTRAAGQRRNQNLAALLAASSSRAQAGSPRRQPARRQKAGRAPPPVPAARGGDDDDDDDGDDSSDDDESSEDEEADRRTVICQLMSIFDHGCASPEELVSGGELFSPISAATRQLAENVLQLVRSPEDLARLQNRIPVAGQTWSRQLYLNMRRRYLLITGDLRDNVQNQAEGLGVVATVERLHRLFLAIDSIRTNHADDMPPGEFNHFVRLLVEMLLYLMDNRDLYGRRRRVASAGQGFQSESKLFSSFASATGHAMECMNFLYQCGPLLREHSPRLQQCSQAARDNVNADENLRLGPDHVHVARVVTVLQNIANFAHQQQ